MKLESFTEVLEQKVWNQKIEYIEDTECRFPNPLLFFSYLVFSNWGQTCFITEYINNARRASWS